MAALWPPEQYREGACSSVMGPNHRAVGHVAAQTAAFFSFCKSILSLRDAEVRWVNFEPPKSRLQNAVFSKLLTHFSNISIINP